MTDDCCIEPVFRGKDEEVLGVDHRRAYIRETIARLSTQPCDVHPREAEVRFLSITLCQPLR